METYLPISIQPDGSEAPGLAIELSHEYHLFDKDGVENPCQVPWSRDKLAPKLVDPDIAGADKDVGVCIDWAVTADQIEVLPCELVLVVLMVMNLPASSDVWV